MSYKMKKYRLKKRLGKMLEQAGFEVIYPAGGVFDIVAFFGGQKRNIFVSPEPPDSAQIELIRKQSCQGKKEIAYRKNSKIEFFEV